MPFLCLQYNMSNLGSWIKQLNSNKNEEESIIPSKFEKDLLSIRDERQGMIRPNCHPTYNQRHQKIIESIEWTLEKYRGRIKERHNEQTIIDDIFTELQKKEI